MAWKKKKKTPIQIQKKGELSDTEPLKYIFAPATKKKLYKIPSAEKIFFRLLRKGNF